MGYGYCNPDGACASRGLGVPRIRCCYLARRLDGLGMLVVATMRPRTDSEPGVIDEITDAADTTVLRLSPLRVARTGVDSLTAEELRVARMAAEGMTNREVAQALFVTAKTVEYHLSHAYSKLSLKSRSQLRSALAKGE